MKRLKIEFYRIYFRYLIRSTDRLIARKHAMETREKETELKTGICAAHGSV